MPTLSLTEAFPMAEVIKVVEKLFERNRFNFNLADSDSDLPGYDEDSETSGDESDEEDSDEEDHKKSSSTKKNSKKKRHSSQDSSDSNSDTETLTCAPPKNHRTTAKSTPTKDTKKQSSTKHTDKDNVEQLIKQLGNLSLDDLKYGLLYYNAIVRGPPD
jgi:ABC-type Zn2+ transport system substrate-binding protein/surface adhesin